MSTCPKCGGPIARFGITSRCPQCFLEEQKQKSLKGKTKKINVDDHVHEDLPGFIRSIEENTAKALKELVPDDVLEAAWGHANFGSVSKREVIRNTLLKCACGYHTGFTAKSICQDLGLIDRRDWKLTGIGMKYLWVAYSKGTSV